jgi:DNA phosphorothioation-associated DGQHR protein 1
MNEKLTFPIRVPALKVTQPLGVFYAAKLSADLLLEITYSDPLRVTAEAQSESSYGLRGSQRVLNPERLKAIARFIETAEAAFPNSIILAANYNKEGELEEKESLRWHIDFNNGDDCPRLVIPSPARLASIIDGQHRLQGFEKVDLDRRSMELLCAVYLDLPYPYQAYVFATINFNQKKVDRSLAYELFGVDVEDEPPESWTPEKTAVFLCRKLNIDESSSFYHHIIVAAQNEEILFRNKPRDVDWVVSTATVVDGILRLISTNPKRDRDLMHKEQIGSRSREVLKTVKDNSPFRKLYLENNDKAVYTAVKNYFTAVNEIFWSHANEGSFIKRTVGIQALFDVLRSLMKDFEQVKKISVDFFKSYLIRASEINFSDPFISQASGLGRSRIRKAIELALGLISESDLQGDLEDYRRLIP